MKDLAALGWNAAWAAKVRPEESALVIGRAAFESRGIYHVLTAEGKTWMAELKGILRKGAGAKAEFPIVGDWVLVEPQDSRRGLIIRVLPRETALIRREQSRNEATRRASSTQMLAANVDWALITSSLNEEWNIRRLERYLGLVREAKLKPALLLTKTDLVDDRGEAIEAEARAIAPDLPILRFNALKGEGIAELKALLGTQGTAVLLGSSGVGKSTLVNALLGRQEMATGEVREKDQRGRHTTVGRYLLPLPWGGCLIDSPGLRDLGLSDENAVEESFEDIAALIPQCRFSDCRHEEEPGCAVQAALAAGTLDPARFDAYVKLKEETALAKKRTQLGAVRYERDRGRVVGKALKSFYKDKGKK
jgi:ribosome biogenesis GTPase